MARSIYFWHGRDKSIEGKIAKICRHDTDEDVYYWDGSLDEFEAAYGGKFIVYPAVGPHGVGQICVTQFSNFGQR